jgi:hypothetical protein
MNDKNQAQEHIITVDNSQAAHLSSVHLPQCECAYDRDGINNSRATSLACSDSKSSCKEELHTSLHVSMAILNVLAIVSLPRQTEFVRTED